ncbi:hypothetical protein BOTBODRAFT_118674, partial [Botryobasidium botryosum FD-172 SS1]
SYHMQYSHGISPKTGLPFSPPIDFRVTKKPNAKLGDKPEVKEGKCHSCKKWIPLVGPRLGEVLVSTRVDLWKHAAACHGYSTLNGESDAYFEDLIFKRLREYGASNPSSSATAT